MEQLTSSILAPAQLNELLDIVDLLRHRVFCVLCSGWVGWVVGGSFVGSCSVNYWFEVAVGQGKPYVRCLQGLLRNRKVLFLAISRDLSVYI